MCSVVRSAQWAIVGQVPDLPFENCEAVLWQVGDLPHEAVSFQRDDQAPIALLIAQLERTDRLQFSLVREVNVTAHRTLGWLFEQSGIHRYLVGTRLRLAFYPGALLRVWSSGKGRHTRLTGTRIVREASFYARASDADAAGGVTARVR